MPTANLYRNTTLSPASLIAFSCSPPCGACGAARRSTFLKHSRASSAVATKQKCAVTLTQSLPSPQQACFQSRRLALTQAFPMRARGDDLNKAQALRMRDEEPLLHAIMHVLVLSARSLSAPETNPGPEPFELQRSIKKVFLAMVDGWHRTASCAITRAHCSHQVISNLRSLSLCRTSVETFRQHDHLGVKLSMLQGCAVPSIDTLPR